MNAVRAKKRRLILLGAVVAMVAATAALWFVRQARLNQNLQRDLEQGMAAYEEGRYEDALSPLSRYVGRRRDDAEVLRAFADTRRKVSPDDGTISHLRHALAVIRLALEAEPASLEGRLLLMEIAAELGYATEADDAAAQVLEADPRNFEAHRLRLDFAARTGRDEARQELARQMAASLPDSFEAQQIAFANLVDADAPPDELERFVGERRAELGERAGSEILAAMLEEYTALRATAPDVWAEHQQRAAEHVLKAAAITPVESAEAEAILTYLDRNTRVAEPSLANDLLHEYMVNPAIADEIQTYAAERAWQRENAALAEEIAAANPDPSALGDDTLGWLALALPDAAAYRDELAAREAASAQEWRRVLDAADLVQAREISAAREAVRPLLQSPSESEAVSRVSAYVDAIALRAAGEDSLAVQRLEQLAAEGAWVRARVALRDIALERGENRRALDLMRLDQVPGSALLLLETAVALDEAGYDWLPSEESGRSLADRAVRMARQDPILLSLHGRAELAAGNAARALEVADELLALEGAEGAAGYVRAFAARLAPLDAGKAGALRDLYGPGASDPLQELALALRDGTLGIEEARARVEAATAGGDETRRLQGELLLAAHLDRTGDAVAAAAEYGRLCEEHPDDALVQLEALRSRSLWESPAQAQQTISRLRSASGEDAIAWRVFSQRLALQNDRSDAAAAKALVELGGVLRVAEEDVLALQLCAEASSRLGDFDRAAGFALRAAEAAGSQLSVALDAVDALVRANRAEEAKTKLLETVALPSVDAGQRARRGTLLVRYGFGAEAMRDWRWLKESGDPASRALSAMMLAQAGERAEAAEIVEQLRALPEPSALVVERTAETLEALGRREEALDLLGRAGDETGATRDARIAQFLARHVRGEEDLAALEEFARSSEDGDAWAAAVRAHMGRGQLDEARRVLAEARSRVAGGSGALEALVEPLRVESENDPKAYLLVARASLAATEAEWASELTAEVDRVLAGDRSLDDLSRFLDRFVQSRPEISMGWLLLLHTKAAAGDRPGTSAAAFAMLSALPTDPGPARAAVDIFRRLQLADEGLLAARAYATRLGAPTLESAAAVAEFALAAGRAGEAWDAIGPWRDRLQSDYEQELYVRAALGAGRVGEASALVWGEGTEARREWLLVGIRMAPMIEDAGARRAWLESATSRAGAAADDAVRLALATAWYQHGVRAADRPGLERAIDLARTSAADPETEGLLRRVEAASYGALDRRGEAEASYRRSLELRPDDPNVLNNLAFLLLNSGGDAREALALAERAVAVVRSRVGQDAGIADFVDTLGLAQLRTAQPELALASFEEALRWQPDYEHARLGRAEALCDLGRMDEARAALQTLVNYEDSLEARVVSLRNRLGAGPP